MAEDEIADVTIKYVLIDADYNDLGLSIGNRLMVLYGSKKVTLPKPELYMIYTGDKKKIPDTISLSEEFFDGEKISVDAEIKVLYQENENCKNRNVLKKYLESKEQEVVDIMMTLFDNQKILKAYTKDMMLGSKAFDPLMLTDFFAFHAHEILKTFKIRTFFCEKWLLSHVLWIPKSSIFMQARK
ncbi:MAG: hypothetical protein IKM28_05185 [Lachnospiraceae bacterium]|nr:hypothetical protein [Lachnospiraceae bacterium]